MIGVCLNSGCLLLRADVVQFSIISIQIGRILTTSLEAAICEFSQSEALRTIVRAQTRKIVSIARKCGSLEVVEARFRAGWDVLLFLLASIQTRRVNIVVRGRSHISRAPDLYRRNLTWKKTMSIAL